MTQQAAITAAHMLGADTGLNPGALALTAEYLGVNDIEGLMDALRVIRTYQPPRKDETEP